MDNIEDQLKTPAPTGQNVASGSQPQQTKQSIKIPVACRSGENSSKSQEESNESPSLQAFKHFMKNDNNFTNCVKAEIQSIAQEIETKMKDLENQQAQKKKDVPSLQFEPNEGNFEQNADMKNENIGVSNSAEDKSPKKIEQNKMSNNALQLPQPNQNPTSQFPTPTLQQQNQAHSFNDSATQNQYIGMNINLNMNMNLQTVSTFQPQPQQQPNNMVQPQGQQQLQSQHNHQVQAQSTNSQNAYHAESTNENSQQSLQNQALQYQESLQQQQIAQLMRFNQNFGTDDNRMLGLQGLPPLAGGMGKGFQDELNHGVAGASALMLNNGMGMDQMSTYNNSANVGSIQQYGRSSHNSVQLTNEQQMSNVGQAREMQQFNYAAKPFNNINPAVGEGGQGDLNANSNGQFDQASLNNGTNNPSQSSPSQGTPNLAQNQPTPTTAPINFDSNTQQQQTSLHNANAQGNCQNQAQHPVDDGSANTGLPIPQPMQHPQAQTELPSSLQNQQIQPMNQSAPPLQHHQYNQSQQALQPLAFDQQQAFNQYGGQNSNQFDYQNQEMQSRLQKPQPLQHQPPYGYQQMTADYATDPNHQFYSDGQYNHQGGGAVMGGMSRYLPQPLQVQQQPVMMAQRSQQPQMQQVSQVQQFEGHQEYNNGQEQRALGDPGGEENKQEMIQAPSEGDNAAERDIQEGNQADANQKSPSEANNIEERKGQELTNEDKQAVAPSQQSMEQQKSEANNQLFISKQMSTPAVQQKKMFDIQQVQPSTNQSQKSKRKSQADQHPSIQEAAADSEGVGSSSYHSSAQSPKKASTQHEIAEEQKFTNQSESNTTVPEAKVTQTAESGPEQKQSQYSQSAAGDATQQMAGSQSNFGDQAGATNTQQVSTQSYQQNQASQQQLQQPIQQVPESSQQQPMSQLPSQNPQQQQTSTNQNVMPFQPIFVQQLSLQQLQQMQQLNFLKESVPCVEYLYGFCMDGSKECMFYHPKSTDTQSSDASSASGTDRAQSSQTTAKTTATAAGAPGQDAPKPPKYKPNECLPKEYLDKVKNYFDDSQITNVNMIQTLMKQMSRQLNQGAPSGQGGHQYNGSADQFDIQSLLGFGDVSRRGYGGGYSNTDTMTLNSMHTGGANKYQQDGGSMYQLGAGGNQYGNYSNFYDQNQSQYSLFKKGGDAQLGRFSSLQMATSGIDPIEAPGGGGVNEPFSPTKAGGIQDNSFYNAGEANNNKATSNMNSTYQNISLSDVFSEQNDRYSNFGDSFHGGVYKRGHANSIKGKYPHNPDHAQDTGGGGHHSHNFAGHRNNNEEINQIMNQTRNVFKGRARYYIVKSNCGENVQNSMEHGVWATTHGPTKKLVHAFRTVENVILIFSLTESSSFQGVARMESEPDSKLKPHIFQKQGFNKDKMQQPYHGGPYSQGKLQFMPNFRVSWLLRCQYPFRDLDHLPGNPLNENMPIQKSFNGQELPSKLGNYLAYLILSEGMPSAIHVEGGSKDGQSKNNKQDSREAKNGDKGARPAVPYTVPNDPYKRIIIRYLDTLEPIYSSDFEHGNADTGNSGTSNYDSNHHHPNSNRPHGNSGKGDSQNHHYYNASHPNSQYQMNNYGHNQPYHGSNFNNHYFYGQGSSGGGNRQNNYGYNDQYASSSGSNRGNQYQQTSSYGGSHQSDPPGSGHRGSGANTQGGGNQPSSSNSERTGGHPGHPKKQKFYAGAPAQQTGSSQAPYGGGQYPQGGKYNRKPGGGNNGGNNKKKKQ